MKNSESKPRVSEQILSATYSENDEDEKAEGSNEPVGAKANPEVHRQKLDVDQLKEIVQKEEARKNVNVPAADGAELIDTRKNPVPEGQEQREHKERNEQIEGSSAKEDPSYNPEESAKGGEKVDGGAIANQRKRKKKDKFKHKLANMVRLACKK